MLTGKRLGDAIRAAIKAKGVMQIDVAHHFGVRPPSVSDWLNRGTIAKEKLPELFAYFSDVVGPEHWGLDRPLAARDPSAAANGYYAIARGRREADPIMRQVIKLLEGTDATGRAMALAAVRVALAGYRPAKTNRVR